MSASSQPPTFPPVAVSATFPHQSLRLLELPRELLDLVETQIQNKKPGGGGTLWFKSSADTVDPTTEAGQRRRQGWNAGSSNDSRATAASGAGADGAREGFLHLCTDDKVWAVRQVSTSNSVYVTGTCLSPPEPFKQGSAQGGNDGDGDTPTAVGAEEQANGDGTIARDMDGLALAAESRGGITTKAQVKNVLELIEVESDEREIERRIHDMVPVYHDTEDDVDPLCVDDLGNDRGLDGRELVSSRDVLDNIPAPTRLIRDVMRKSFIFGLSRPTTQKDKRSKRAVYIPTAALLLRRWRDFLQQCTISDVDLEKNGGVLSGRSLRAVLDGLAEAEVTDKGGALALNVTMAILRWFTDELEDDASDHSKLRDPPTLLDLDLDLDALDEEQLLGARLKFNPDLSRELVGHWLLLSHARKQSSLPDSSESNQERIRVDRFIAEWAQLLPDSWANQCDVPGLISSVDGVDIARHEEGVEVLRFTMGKGSHASKAAAAAPSHGAAGAGAGAGASLVAGGLPKDAKSQNLKKRKWHEIFGAQRTAPAVKR